jgi:hypothetical protein
MRVRVVHLLPVALALLFAGCSYGTLAPVRFTYVVKYSVATSAATVSPISYMDATSALVPEPAPTAVWSLELAPMTYDYASPFYPQLVATGAALAAGESATVTISWKDYRTGFAEEVLAQQTVTDAGVGGTPLDITLYAPELPLTR